MVVGVVDVGRRRRYPAALGVLRPRLSLVRLRAVERHAAAPAPVLAHLGAHGAGRREGAQVQRLRSSRGRGGGRRGGGRVPSSEAALFRNRIIRRRGCLVEGLPSLQQRHLSRRGESGRSRGVRFQVASAIATGAPLLFLAPGTTIHFLQKPNSVTNPKTSYLPP